MFLSRELGYCWTLDHVVTGAQLSSDNDGPYDKLARGGAHDGHLSTKVCGRVREHVGGKMWSAGTCRN